MRTLVAAAILCFGLLLGVGARAEAATPSVVCKYPATSPNYLPSVFQPCPIPTALPYGAMNGNYAYQFTDGVGINTHITYLDTLYANEAYMKAALLALQIHHVRSDSLADAGTDLYSILEIEDLYQSGIYTDAIVNVGDTEAGTLAAINTLGPALESIEGPNEWSTSGGGSHWITDDRNTTINVMHPAALAANHHVSVIVPSIVFYQAANQMGDLSPWVDYGNMHDYSGGHIPENTGYGSLGNCGQPYGTSLYAICNYYQAALSRPLISTESGQATLQYGAGDVDEISQGSYNIRQMLDHFIHGVYRYYIYDLFDENPGYADDYWGMMNSDGSQKKSFKTIAGFMQIMQDPSHVKGACTVPVTLATPAPTSTAPPYRVVGFCKTTGEYDLVAYQTVASYDQEAFVVYPNPAIYIPVLYKSGFTPSSAHFWSYDTNGNWTADTTVGPTPSSMALTDRVSVLVFNRPSPVPLPALPSPPPTPQPTPTPTAPPPTPTPAPTAKPTSVAIKTTGVVMNSGQVGMYWAYASPAPSASPNASYGDYIYGAFAFPYEGAPRSVVSPAPGFSLVTGPVIYPQWQEYPGSTQASYNTAYNTFNYLSYGKYVTNQAGETNPDYWVTAGGYPSSSIYYDFKGADSVNPIGAENYYNSQYSDFTTVVHAYCQNLTVPRVGSQVILIIAGNYGGPNSYLYPNGSTNLGGWTIDQQSLQQGYAPMFSFHYNALTTTPNQVITGPTVGIDLYYNPNICEMIAIQPPA